MPADFWDSSNIQQALATRHMGAVVRAFRIHSHHGRQIPQAVAAGWLHLTQSQLSRVENGPPIQDLDRLTQWADALHIPRHLLWFAPTEQHDTTPDEPHPQATAQAETEPSAAFPPHQPAQIHNQDQAQRPLDTVPPHLPTGDNVGNGHVVWGDEDEMKRRALLAMLTAIGTGATVPPGALKEILSGIEEAIGAHADVDDWERTVAEYEYMASMRPIGSLIEDLSADIIAVGRLLKRGYPPDIQTGLVRVSAGLSWQLAAQFDDIGDRQAARTSWSTARRAAESCGDRNLLVWVLSKEASMARWSDRPDHMAAQLADQAIHLSGGAPSKGLAQAYAVRSSLAARTGDAGAYDAHQALNALADIADHGGWSAKYLAWTQAYAYTLLGDQRATSTLEQAIDRLHPEHSANSEMIQALALIQHREIDAGLEQATTITQARPLSACRRHIANQIVRDLPGKAQALPAARELRVLTAGKS